MTATTGRIFGDSRTSTAVAVARAVFGDGSGAVYLADQDPADVPTAAMLPDGPLLLVPGSGPVPGIVAEEIARLGPATVIAVGGADAVTPDVLLDAAAGRPTARIDGAGTVATSVAITAAAFPEGAHEVLVVAHDAPLLAAVAAATGSPVLLVDGVETTGRVAAEIARLDPQRVVVVGTPGALSDDVLERIAGGRPVIRLEGRTPADTAVAVADHAYPEGADEAYLVAVGAVSDAVVAGALRGGPLLVVPGCDPLPPATGAALERLAPDRVTAVGGPAAVCTDVLREAAGQEPADCGASFVDVWGPASVAAAVVGAAVVGERLYVATRGRVPTVVGALDLATDDVVTTVDLPTGEGAWGVTPGADGVVVGTYEPADVYLLDPSTLRTQRLASLAGASHVFCAATAPDGTVLVGTARDGAVYAVDPATGTVRSYGAAVPGQYLVRSIAADADTIYAGVGAQAHLVAIDRPSGARRNLLPPDLADESFVYTLALTERWIVIGTEPSGRVAVAPAAAPDDWRVLPATGERTVDAIAVDGDTIWFTGRTTGALYRYEIGGAAPQQVAVPLAREETRFLTVHGGVVLGVGGSGVVWRVDPVANTVTTTDLRDAGLPGGPEEVQSLAADEATAYVGGHWGLQIHTGEAATRRVRAPGEPKALLPVDGTVYLALYPGAELWAYPAGADAPEPVARIEHGQARPRRMALHRRSGRVLVVSQADYGQRGGALAIYDPAADSIVVHRDVIAEHGLSAVAVDGDTAYLGSELRSGGGLPPAPGPARVAAWDLRRSRTVWEIEPFAGAAAVVDLVAVHGLVYGYIAEGVVFALNPLIPQVVGSVRLSGSERALITQRGLLYAAYRGGLTQLDPDSLEPTNVLKDPVTNAAAGPGCTLFAVRGTDLVHVNP